MVEVPYAFSTFTRTPAFVLVEVSARLSAENTACPRATKVKPDERI
jgi:hypothetical protein